MRELVAAGGSWLLPGGVVSLWLAGFGCLLLLAVTPFRYAAGGALRIFSIAVAVHALFSLLAIQAAARLSDQRQNPSDALSAAGAALVASGLVALFGCWRGRAWTPKPRAGPELPAAIDWSREGRHGLIILLVAIALVSLLVLSIPIWGGLLLLLVLVLLLLGSSEPWRWSAGSIEFGFLLAAVVALAVYVWLSTGKRGAQRAPIGPTLALPLGALCSLLAISLPTWVPSFAEPAFSVLHDGALCELLRDSAARDDGESFEKAQRALTHRPSDGAQAVVWVSRKLRRISGGSASMSARLAAHVAANPRGSSGHEDFLGSRPRASLSGDDAPELAVIDVLLARGAKQEVLAWVGDPEVPLGLRVEIVESRSLARMFSRAILIGSFAKACVEARQRGTPADVPRSYARAGFGCQSTINRLLPADQSAVTIEQSIAASYAMVALGEPSIVEYSLARMSDENAVAMLRGVRAAERADDTRTRLVASARIVDCSRLAHLAALICPTDRLPACFAEDGENGLQSLALLASCVAQLPADPPELARLGGY